MKRGRRKLTLSRETLVSLENDLQQVVAGVYTQNPDICFSGYQTCASCVRTCTTNRC